MQRRAALLSRGVFKEPTKYPDRSGTGYRRKRSQGDSKVFYLDVKVVTDSDAEDTLWREPGNSVKHVEKVSIRCPRGDEQAISVPL